MIGGFLLLLSGGLWWALDNKPKVLALFEEPDLGANHREWLRCMENWSYPCPDCGAATGEPC